jgi:hypothetical protein
MNSHNGILSGFIDSRSEIRHVGHTFCNDLVAVPSAFATPLETERYERITPTPVLRPLPSLEGALSGSGCAFCGRALAVHQGPGCPYVSAPEGGLSLRDFHHKSLWGILDGMISCFQAGSIGTYLCACSTVLTGCSACARNLALPTDCAR